MISFIVIPFIFYLITLFLISRRVQSIIGKKLKGVRYDLLVAFVEISALLLGIFIYRKNPSTFGITFGYLELSVFLGIFFGTISILIEYFWLDVRLFISEEMMRILPKIELRFLLRRVFGLMILFPISEEVLYRGCIQMVLTRSIGFFSIIVTTFLFAIQHFIDPGARRHYLNRKNQGFLFYEGLVLGAVVYVGGSLLGSIAAHMLMNLLNAWVRIEKYLHFNDP